MAHLITFSTDAFDPSSEPENPFNPIAGQSVLVWLREHALEGYESSEPDCEDWGWYIEVQGGDSVYTVGAICFDDEGDGGQGASPEWMIQVVKRRTLGDVVRRRNRMAADDRLTLRIAEALRANVAFDRIEVEFGR